jgi:alkaline phosphatase
MNARCKFRVVIAFFITNTNCPPLFRHINDRRSILEDAMSCDKSGGIMASVPILHATPGAFVTHTNFRNSKFQLQKGFEEAEPT